MQCKKMYSDKAYVLYGFHKKYYLDVMGEPDQG